MKNNGHGHVSPREDGVKARCGGPSICMECSKELKQNEKPKMLMIHNDLLKAIEEEDYEKIASFLHTKLYSSDSKFTVERCVDSFIQGWQECERISEIIRDGI